MRLSDLHSKVDIYNKRLYNEDMDKMPTIYLDMDGVLADFFGGVEKLYGVDHWKELTNDKTKDLKSECKKADILVAAAGVANLVKRDWVKKNVIIIDVGINKVGDKIVGDVCFNEVKDKAKAITPVPGGVGPMTIACLLKNTLECFKDR